MYSRCWQEWRPDSIIDCAAAAFHPMTIDIGTDVEPGPIVVGRGRLISRDRALKLRCHGTNVDRINGSGERDPESEWLQRAGYSEPSHFSRRFQDKFGVTPAVYRAQALC